MTCKSLKFSFIPQFQYSTIFTYNNSRIYSAWTTYKKNNIIFGFTTKLLYKIQDHSLWFYFQTNIITMNLIILLRCDLTLNLHNNFQVNMFTHVLCLKHFSAIMWQYWFNSSYFWFQNKTSVIILSFSFAVWFNSSIKQQLMIFLSRYHRLIFLQISSDVPCSSIIFSNAIKVYKTPH